ncbi:helix-turn-helix domain-containing protein [Deinococcus sp. Leaf326]|uniref:helix-turn-helix domain-containing protein n=1 Tax=Deinococcus sp. Leaf326 TaxID=1736338 RepID=UPI0006FDB5BD|nr:helix-turn-helix domain-containing protein [Deinococcus sp. Leaf326]KQQ99421.1 hypothetical protein ASF71_13700 [Deinococcus sp. Leaf326]
MRFRRSAPDPRLSEFVQCYWQIEDMDLAWPELNYDMPERTMRLMFSAEAIWTGPSADTLELAQPVVLTPFLVQSQRLVGQGRLRVLMAELYPWGARQLLGWTSQEAPGALNTSLSASPWGREVVALVRLGEWAAAQEALETRLLHLAGAQGETGMGVQAARRIYEASGTVRVADLAAELGLSPRTLERQFAQQVGVSPKTLARVVRFDAANLRIRTDPEVPVAELIFELGFFDQAHLIREFRALSSMTPGTFAALAARRRHALDLDVLLASGDRPLDLPLDLEVSSEFWTGPDQPEPQ